MADINRDRRVANTLLAVFCVASVLSLSLPLSVPVRSLRACVSYLIDPLPFLGGRSVDRLSGMPAGVVRLLRTDIENLRLREDVKRLAWLETELRSLRLENERFREALGMRPAAGVALLWARVIERDAVNWYRVIMVAAGRRDGLEVGAPVLGLDGGRLGAVGRVTEAGASTSKVLLLSDELSSVAGYSPARQWEGLVDGQGGPRLLMNYLPVDAVLSPGEPVYTSATSATFPPDVLIGTVTRVFERDPFLTFQSAEVTLAIRPWNLKEVLVLKTLRPEPAAPPRAGAPPDSRQAPVPR